MEETGPNVERAAGHKRAAGPRFWQSCPVAPPSSPQRPPARGSSIAARLFLAVGLPGALLVIALGVLAWFGAERTILASLDRELKATVAIGASSINPLMARLLVPDEGKESRSYKNLVRRLATIRDATKSARVMLVGDDELVRADSDGALPVFAQAPRVALDRTEFLAALAGAPKVSVPFESGDGRKFLAAYAKVPERSAGQELLEELAIDGEHQRSFVLVVEAPAEALDATRAIASYLGVLVLLFLLVVFGLAVLLARTITKPVLALAVGAEKLAAGELELPLEVPRGKDEVAFLGHTLEGMRRSLRDRDEERQMMLAGIAHEVRNPLGGMELFGGLLEETIAEMPLDRPPTEDERDELRSHAQRVRKELTYLTGVVNDFLAFARETEVSRTKVNVTALLEDVASLKNKPGHVPVTVQPDFSGSFALEEGRIKEALLNLVENAQQATPADGQVTLFSAADGDDLLLGVRDTGKGMDASTRTRVFQPFFTTKEKGSGLGLPLVAKFARDHGGSAEVESAPGEGTTITLRLRPGPVSARSSFKDDEPGLLGDDEPDPDREPLLGDG